MKIHFECDIKVEKDGTFYWERNRNIEVRLEDEMVIFSLYHEGIFRSFKISKDDYRQFARFI